MRDGLISEVQACRRTPSQTCVGAPLRGPPGPPSARRTPHRSCLFRGGRVSARSRRQRRSEERRVGKECRSRWWPYQLKKKKHDHKKEAKGMRIKKRDHKNMEVLRIA